MSSIERLVLPARSRVRIVVAIGLLAIGAYGAGPVRGQGSTALSLHGASGQTVALSLSDLANMPHQTLRILNSHTNQNETYSGVPLVQLLARVGAPQGRDMRGAGIALVVLAEASDGYRAAFALAELDPGIGDAQVLVVDRLNDAPLDAHQGPLKLIVPRDKRPARSVRMLNALKVVAPAG